MDILGEISRHLQAGSEEKVADVTRRAVKTNIPPKEILDKGLISGMNIIGEKYKAHEIFLPDVLLAAKAMYAGMDVLRPLFVKEDMPSAGKVVIGTVQGDLHDIGKNLVGIMLKGAGFEVIDLGNDVAPESFVETARKENASVIGMSALLTTTMPAMKRVIDYVKNEGLDSRIKTIIGGAPVSEEYAREIGADAYGYDSTHAVECVKKLIAEMHR
ncbi:methyltransferase [candidate division WOR_3 bacterium SM23_60]|uniref:Methyltransferase n=1 Tax=candidate division WOR_3 bacterium SM23_60 TaxID=1703780 RepID=A0A0S8G4W5_UNCW3|nr:MAG: methyltransferase [candidate division WOR_3 bacterium SM23_60]